MILKLLVLAFVVALPCSSLLLRPSIIRRNGAFHTDPFGGKVEESLGLDYHNQIRTILGKCGYKSPFSLEDKAGVGKVEWLNQAEKFEDGVFALGDVECWSNLQKKMYTSFCPHPPNAAHNILGEIKPSYLSLVTAICDEILEKGKSVGLSKLLRCSLPKAIKCVFVTGPDSSREIERLKVDSLDIYKGKNLTDVLVAAGQDLNYGTMKNVARQIIKDNSINIFYSSSLSKEYLDGIEDVRRVRMEIYLLERICAVRWE